MPEKDRLEEILKSPAWKEPTAKGQDRLQLSFMNQSETAMIRHLTSPEGPYEIQKASLSKLMSRKMKYQIIWRKWKFNH